MEIQRKDRELYQAITFVEKAVDKKHPKMAIRNFLIENNTLIGTDSHRMHMINSEAFKDLENGLYIIEKDKTGLSFVKATCDSIYPDWKSLLNKDEKITDREVFSSATKGKFISDILYFLSKKDIKLDYTYLLNLYNSKWKWEMFLYGRNEAIAFKMNIGEIKYCALMMRYGGE